MASIKPEYLMEPRDYKEWVKLQRAIDAKRHASGHRDVKLKTDICDESNCNSSQRRSNFLNMHLLARLVQHLRVTSQK